MSRPDSKSKSSSGRQSSSSSSSRQAPVNEEFLHSFSFRNTLPAVPSGPFFKKIGMSHTATELAKYNTSTIEKSYIWQPHFDRDVNIRLDLVDQEAMLHAQNYIDPSTLATECKYYLSGATDRNSMDSRKKDKSGKHWWLRETVYSENYILKNRSSTSETAPKTLSDEEDLIDPFTIEAIQDSFVSILGALEKKAAEIEWSMPVLPSELYSSDHYSFVAFDEHPGGANVKIKAESQSSESQHEQERKRPRLQSNIITNIRVSKTKKGSGDTTFAASMVMPLETEAEAESPELDNETSRVAYKWKKDYRMVMRNKELSNQFVLLVDSAQPAVTFFAVGVDMEMGRLQVEEVDTHDAIIERREEEEEEEEVDAEQEEEQEEQGGQEEEEGDPFADPDADAEADASEDAPVVTSNSMETSTEGRDEDEEEEDAGMMSEE